MSHAWSYDVGRARVQVARDRPPPDGPHRRPSRAEPARPRLRSPRRSPLRGSRLTAAVRAGPTSRCQGDHMVKPDAATAGPVFFDPTGRRRRGLRAAAAAAAGAACALAAGVVIGLTAPAQAPPTSVTSVAPSLARTAAGGADPARPASISVAGIASAAKHSPAKHSAAKHKATKHKATKRKTAKRKTATHSKTKAAPRRRAGR